MPLKNGFPGLISYLKGDAATTMNRYFVQGKGEVRLGQTDFKAQGGEGAIYVKGSTAYKIYRDPQRSIPPLKIQELSVLTQPNIIRPLDLLLDAQSRPVGYSMRHVGKAHALCQLFPAAFRRRNGLTPDGTFRLVRRLQEGVRHVHDRSILIVDLNEMNFLVSANFKELFFIDVDSYQTPSYAATVLMESVRDRHAREFTTGSDWFSFAVVAFQMFVGIHPFKGTYPPLRNLPDKDGKLDARMRANISVLNAGVSVPASCLPFDLIPPSYLEWFRAVFEEGKRLPPPEAGQTVLTLTTTTTAGAKPQRASRHFVLTEAGQFDGEIIRHDGLITVTADSVYFDGQKYPKPHGGDVKVAVTPRLRHLVAAYMDGARLCCYDLTARAPLALGVECEEFMLSNGQFYLKQGEQIFAVEFVELGRAVLAGVKLAANVMLKSTRLFEGAAIQNLLGSYYASLLPAAGVCHQVRLPELDGYQLIDARLERNILVVVGARGGCYDKLIFRFADDFRSYDVRETRNLASTALDFTVLDSGIVLHLTDEGHLEIFSRRVNFAGVKTIQDESVEGDVRLFHSGVQALVSRGGKLYRISMR